MSKATLLKISKKISSGLTPLRSNTSFWENGSIPWLKTEQLGVKYIYDTNEKISKNALAETSIKINPKNTLSVAMYGEGKTRGSVSILKSEMTTNQACCNIFIDENKANHEYVYYFLKMRYENLRNLSSGVRKNLNSNDLKNFKINLPNAINDQQKIAYILSTLDDKIELNNKINSELEVIAKTLYDYWFMQFDFPDENGKPYKNNGGKMVFDEKLKRKIPEGWKIDNLKNNSLSKLLKPKIDEFDGEKKYLATAAVQNQNINFQAEKITFEDRPSRANMQPIENSIWFAKMKNSKKVLCFSEYSKKFLNDFILSTGFAGLKCEKDSLEYIWGFINNDRFEFIKDGLANGATQEAINNDTMVFINLIIPQDKILNKYHLKTKSIYQKVYNNQIENQKLVELRDWLLPMLMNGQVAVG